MPDSGYTLAVQATGNGVVGIEPDQSTYDYGQVVTLTATAEPGWSFVGWGGDLSGDENPVAVVIDGDKDVTAEFAEAQYVLTIQQVGSGSVSKVPDQPFYYFQDPVTLTAEADSGWVFGGWSGDLTGDESTAELIMDSSKEVTATFLLLTNLQLDWAPPAAGDPAIVVSPTQETYVFGQVITLIENPDVGWELLGWDGPSSLDVIESGEGQWSLEMDGDKDLTAVFAKKRYAVIVNTIGDGTVVKQPDVDLYSHGTQVRLWAVPSPGWGLGHWEGDLEGRANPATITVDGEKQITAVFRQFRIYLPVVLLNNQ
jgi:hypothetical protein